jgi:glycosyltransferase involved in cell wall biosynthesis
MILETSTHLERIEIIVVDDCSTDSSPQVIERFKKETESTQQSKIRWSFLRHKRNGGKGQAVKTALELATCDICVIHDADLEYHAKDLLRIVGVFVEQQADVVYGSRFAGGELRRILMYRHELGNRLLTFLSNLVTNLNLSDWATGC